MGDERRPLVLRWRAAIFSSSESASVKLTLLALAEHASPQGRDCWPSVETLAKQTSQGEKTCRRALEVADGKWFSREPMKFSGRQWRGYSYCLMIPGGAVTMTGPKRELAVTMTGPKPSSSGQMEPEVRSLSPRGAVTVTDDLGRAPRKSTKGPKKARAPMVTFAEWFTSMDKEPSRAIPDDDPIWDFADEIELPHEFLSIAWLWFEHRYIDDDKQYRDWRAVFRRCVREDWHRCWRTNRATNQAELTEAGLMLQKLLRE